MRTLIPIVIAAGSVFGLVGSAFAFHDGGDGEGSDQKTSAPLVRPDDPPDPDALGELMLRRKTRGDSVRDSMKVKARDLPVGVSFDLWMANGEGVMDLVRTFKSDDGKGDDEGDDNSGGDDQGSQGDDEGGDDENALGDDGGSGDDGDGNDDEGEGDDDGESRGDEGTELEMEFENGNLPFEAASLDELAGRRVEIRAGDLVYLMGLVPTFDAASAGSRRREHTGVALSRGEDAPDEDCRGQAELDNQEQNDRARFDVECRGLPEQDYFVDVANDEGDMEEAGVLEPKGHGRYRIRLDTKKGEPLPLGILDADDLDDRRIEIRGEDDEVYLAGTLGHLTKRAKNGKSDGELSGEGVQVRVKLVSQPRVPNESFELRARHLVGVDAVIVRIDDPEAELFVDVAELDVKNGAVRMRLRTKAGDALPLGVSHVKDLAGRAIQLVNADTDEVLAEGTLPGM